MERGPTAKLNLPQTTLAIMALFAAQSPAERYKQVYRLLVHVTAEALQPLPQP